MKEHHKTVLYTGLVAAATGFFYIYLAVNYPFPDINTIVIWSLVALLTKLLPITLPGSSATINAGYTVITAAMITNGPLLAPTIFAISTLFQVRKGRDKLRHVFNTPFYKTLFNAAQVMFVAAAMGLAYESLVAAQVLPAAAALIAVPLGIGINLSVITGFIVLEQSRNFYDVWRTNFTGIVTISVVQGIFGTILAIIYAAYPWAAGLAFFAALYILRYLYTRHSTTINSYMSTMAVINRLLEAKDPYTSGHASRVQDLAVELAAALGLRQQEIDRIGRAAMLHDIGKVGVIDTILNKPGKLTVQEYEEVKKHSALGAEIVGEVVFLQDCVKIIRHHHERYDGKGYPDGLKGEEIPAKAAIIAIADAYDAMTSERPYRAALSEKEALQEIIDNASTQFHPRYATVFYNLMYEKPEPRVGRPKYKFSSS